MKLLIVGIDGGTEKIFNRFHMPFWSKIKGAGQVIPIREDLLHRGWAKIVSGQMATENGSFYFRPKLDGTRDFTDKYNLLDMQQAPGFTPLWQYPLDTNAQVGIMNIPTIAPVQECKGFFVAGGGGGVYTGGMPENSCHPREIEKILKSEGYVFDIRLGKAKFNTRNDLCEKLNDMMERRTRTFIQLAKKDIEFGFLAYRATSVILYLAMYEIEQMILSMGKKGEPHYDSPWLAQVDAHFLKLDQSLEQLFNELGPDNFMIVSDHSMIPYRYDADLNFKFVDSGMAKFNGGLVNLTRNLARIALRPAFRSAVSVIPGFRGKLKAIGFCGAGVRGSSSIFGAHYVGGAFVNDRRFNGPISEENVEKIVDEAVALINDSPEASSAGWQAVPYRRNYIDHHYSNAAPDIKIEQDGSTFFNSQAGSYLRPNENYRPVDSVRGVSGMHSGQKGDQPLLLVNRRLASTISDSDPRDLRLVHGLTKKLFQAG